jgi:hypothetical protein
VALRFPRMLRWRHDKPVDEIDTLDTLSDLLPPTGDRARALTSCAFQARPLAARQARLPVGPAARDKGLHHERAPLRRGHRHGGRPQRARGACPTGTCPTSTPRPDAPELKRDMDWLEGACASFATDYEGKLATLDAHGLLDAVRRYERIDQVAGRIMSFAGLRYYQLTTDGERAKFFSDCQDRVTNFTTPLVFWSLEFNRLDDDHLAALLGQSQELHRYKPVFDRMRAMKPYQLSDELEKFLHDASVVGASAWNKLFDETQAALEYEVNGETLNIEGTLNLLTDQDRSKREAAFHALAKVFGENTRTFARIHNTLAKEKEIEDRWRGLPPRRRAATSPTTSSPRWSRRCAMRSSRPIRACRTATTGSRPAGSASTGFRSGTATRRCPPGTTGSSAGTRPRAP